MVVFLMTAGLQYNTASDVVISRESRWPSVLRGGVLAELEVVMAVVLPCNLPALGAVCRAARTRPPGSASNFGARLCLYSGARLHLYS